MASHYGFSPRLLGLMGCEPLTPALVVPEEHVSRRQALVQAYKDRMSMEKHPEDLEASETGDPPDDDKPLDINHYHIVDEVWHYCSVDWGSKCKTRCSTNGSRLSQGRFMYWLQFSP